MKHARYHDVRFSLCDPRNPGLGYEVQIHDALTGELLLWISRDPETGRDLETAADCLRLIAQELPADS